MTSFASSFYRSGVFTSVVVTLLLALCNGQQVLLADYTFEQSSILPFSGVCPFPAFLASPTSTGGTLSFVGGLSGLGTALNIASTSSPYVNAGTWSISPSGNSYTLAAWVQYGSISSGHKGTFLEKTANGGPTSWGLGVKGLIKNVAAFTFLAQLPSSSVTVQTTNNFTMGTWYHVAGVFNDGGYAKIYVNGVFQQSSNLHGQSLSEVSSPVYIGGASFTGAVDEVRIYNYALSASQVAALAAITHTQYPPAVKMPAPLTVPVGSPAELIANATTNSSSSGLTYDWTVLGGCITANFSDATSSVTDVTIENGAVFQTYLVQLAVSDGLLCTVGTVTVALDGTTPSYEVTESTYPSDGILGVPIRGTTSINLIVLGDPAPSIRWQELVDITSTRALPFRHGVFDDDTRLLRMAAIFELCNATANITTQCSQWTDIANATSARYTTPPGDSNLNHTEIRFVLSNSKGTFTSDPVEIVVTNAIIVVTGNSSGDGGSNVGVIVGPIVGGLAAICCLCVFCLLIIILILLLRKRAYRDGFPGVPPDYEQVIFGPYLDSMYKVKSKHEPSLQKLEKLLISDNDYILALAIARGSKKNNEESLARSFTYLFYAHGRGMKVMELFISQILDTISDPSTMFRANTVDSKMFKYFALLVASQYLWEVLAEFVWEIQKDALSIDGEDDEEMGSSSVSRSLSMSRGSKGKTTRSRVLVGMELDPTRIDEAADPKVNTLQLWLTAQKIFSSITHSSRDMPQELAEMLVFIHDTVKEKFQGQEYKAMGGFLFLRYVCPSLLAPHLYGLLEEPPTPTAQRQLILVGKVLQNLSNDTLPGAKEEYMQKLNEFITNNQAELLGFFDQILGSSGLVATNREIPSQVKKNALADIYNILLSCKEGVYQELSEYHARGDPIFEELDAILAGGPIPSEQRE